MKITDLSAEDQALLKMEFPAELEKEAAAEVEKVNDLYSTGFDKLASEMADEADKGEKDEEEDKKKHEHLSEEHKKEAAARGMFIARGAIDGLLKEGSERKGDEFHYLYPAIAEKLGMDMSKVKALGAKVKGQLGAAADKAKAGASAAKEKATAAASNAAASAKAQAKAHGKHMAGAGAIGALAGYGIGKKKKD